MSANAAIAPNQFAWKPQPEAQRLITGLVTDFLARCPGADALARRMKSDAGSRLADWIDHLRIPQSDQVRVDLLKAGFVHRPLPGAVECYHHAGAIFPEVVFQPTPVTVVAIKVESVADFLAIFQVPLRHPTVGDPLAQMRCAPVFAGQNAELWVIERHGYRAYTAPTPDPVRAVLTLRHTEAFRRRQRFFQNDAEGFAHAGTLADAAIRDLGADLACDLFFATEREYWQRRNRAAQVQKTRQDRLGLGWANHDHHTYRSSRHCFTHLIAFFEKLGFHCRERFYAGGEAGWGAQVLEQPTAGITIFADVDMSPEEIQGDFAHVPMAPTAQLGTVGLWCALHGEAFLQAGMHHLECQFDWHALKEQLSAQARINTMEPFTTFPYLRQAFTEGERWPVAEARIAALLVKGQITQEQAAQFRKDGAVGSHLENLERNDGYKGFNQEGVSEIITQTNPRRLAAMLGA
jgi:hypothetical protein